MLENYLNFFYLNASSIIDEEETINDMFGDGNFGIKIDENGAEILGGVNENTPPEIVELFNLIEDKMDSLHENGQYNKLTGDDIEQIISHVFMDNLGEPDSIIENETDGITFEKRSWRIGDGLLSRTIIKPKSEDEIKKMDKNSIEYLEVKLQEAIDIEDYDKAAEIRDKITNHKDNTK